MTFEFILQRMKSNKGRMSALTATCHAPNPVYLTSTSEHIPMRDLILVWTATLPSKRRAICTNIAEAKLMNSKSKEALNPAQWKWWLNWGIALKKNWT